MTATEQDIRVGQEKNPQRQCPPPPVELPASPADAPLRGNETVLVVEDEPLVLELMADILGHFGYRVLEASGALEAQYLMGAGEKIHLLITDFSMPKANGLALARWLQGKHPDLQVLITTGSLWELVNQIGDEERVAVLPKPFDAVQLGRMVRLVLG